ncbi:FtsX-like permease family protein [Streptacidiphilus sp. PAMC 29251]
MLSIALATVRTRWVSFVGAFIALALGTALISMMSLALAATIGTPHQGPQRFAAAQTVVVPADPRGDPMELPAALPAALVAKADAAGATVSDRTFDTAWPNGPADAVGHGWSSAALTPYRLTSGRAPAADEIVVGSDSGLRAGRTVQLLTPLGVNHYTVVGVVGQKWFESAVFFADTEAARLSPPVNALAVAAGTGAVRGAVGAGPLVLGGDDRQQADPDPSGGSDALINAQSMAATTAGIAVSVAVFIVIATFAFVVEQRSRELALLRLVGASPRQVRQMVRAEAGLIGVAAALVGCVLGCVGAAWLNSWMIDNGVAPAWFHIGINPIALFVACLLGVGSAVLGAAAVALRASRTRPVSALRESAASGKAMTPVRWILGLGLLAAAVATGLSIAGDSPVYAVNPRKYGMVPLLYVGGLALLAPVLLRPVARIAGWPLSRFGAGSLIVRQNTLNARRRTAAMVTPVVIAVGLVAAMVCMQTSGDHTRVQQARQTSHADLVVLPEVGATLDRSATTALSSLPGATATTVTSAHIYIGDAKGHVLDSLNGKAVAPSAMGTALTPQVLEGRLTGLGDDFIVVDSRTAKGDDLTLGQKLTVWLPDSTVTHLVIGAIIQTGLAGDDTYLSSTPVTGALPSMAWVELAPGATTADAAAVASGLAQQSVQVVPADAYFNAMTAEQKKETQTAAVVILGITVGYSLISVANTLIMAAAGRRREFAALNLAGATRAQILRVVGAESLLAVLIGTLLAAIAGAAVVVTQRLSLRHLISRVPTLIPWAELWQAVALCTAVAVTAGVLSAWRTTRGSSIQAAAARE